MHEHLTTRPRRWSVAVALAALLTLLGVLLAAPPASAASQGAGFGTWAPLSSHGWHGSMLVNGVHTYCIVPGLPAPTGDSVDHGVSTNAAGLSPQQLAGINLLVTKYGQTSDPVQGAAVGWAVKATANRDAALHGWGYRGDSLAEAVHWSFATVAPEQAGAVAHLAEIYYAEAATAAVPAPSGTLMLSTDEGDPRKGTVRLEADPSARGTLTLTHAVFADTGSTERSDAAPGVDYAIVSAPPTDDGMPYSVHAAGRFTVGFAPAVRHFTTGGQQDTAGPGGPVEFTVEASDAAPRPVTFSPGITTLVAAPEAHGGPFIDDVTIEPVEGVWPRSADGSHVALRATATVYRTETEPVASPEVPADAVPIGELELVTDPEQGGGTYRVTSDWPLPRPGVYTAVWQISAAAQEPAVARHLERDYLWSEEFATPTQIVRVPTPPPAPTPPAETPPDEVPDALAATGPHDEANARIGGAAVAAVVLGGALLAQIAQQRRRTTSP